MRRIPVILALFVVSALQPFSPSAFSAGATPPDISGFDDSSSHWRKIKGSYFIQPTSRDQPRYDKTQVREIADNILLFQRKNGGWPKDYDMCAILTPEQRRKVIETRDKNDTSYDNHNIHAQVIYLAQAHAQTREKKYRDACLRGLDYIFASQLNNGGFPQRYPHNKGYAGYITFNDGVMMGVMNALEKIAQKRDGFEWLDDATAAKARAAVDRGVACLLAIQYVNKKGEIQGWGQQHDPRTLRPATARVFEHASLSPSDTTEIVRFLMRIEKPSPEIIRSIRAACAWLEQTKLTGIRVEKFKADYTEMRRHNTDSDRRVVADPDAPPLWARMTELETNRPIFSGMDGVIRYNLSEIDRDRRTGYGWYGSKPAKLLSRDYPAWLKKNGLK